jgi:hypothetical protein
MPLRTPTILSLLELRYSRLCALLRLEYWLAIRARGGDSIATLERQELKIVLDKRKCPNNVATLRG